MTDDIIEAAVRALRDESYMFFEMDEAGRLATAMLTAVAPLIRAAALEEAAKVAEDEDGEYWYAGEHRNMAMLQQCCREIANRIRALKPASPSPSDASA